LDYELMVRFESDSVSARAGEIFDALLARSRRIERGTWRKSRTWLARWQERLANFLLARVDPYLSLRQWQSLPD
jgi:phosphatidylserine/phosphatidylglycerophosphate/cardiolipin synthase-like enzyme